MIGALKNNDYILSIFQKTISIISGIITVSLINRYLGTTLKGEYEYILNIVNVLYILLGLGFNSSYIYMKRKNTQNQLQKYLDLFFFQALIYTIIGLIIFYITKNFNVLLIVLLTVTKVLNNQMQSIGVVEFITFRQLLQILTYIIDLLFTFIVYVFIPKNMYALLLILSLKYIIYIIAYLFKCNYIPNPLKIDFKFVKKILKISIFAMLTALLSEFNYSIDIFVMKEYLPFSEIGLYSVGSKLAQYVWLIPDAFKEVLYSHTSKKDSINEVELVMRLNIFITIMFIILITIFGKFIITILYGKEYINSYLVTIIVFLGIPSMVLYKLLSPLYTANGRQKKCFEILLISVLSNIIMNKIVIPTYGKIGAAFSTIISYTLCGMILFFDFIKIYKLNWKDCILIKKNDFLKIKNKIFKLFKKENLK